MINNINSYVPRIFYFICSTPRTGSELLCQILKDTQIAGQPAEHIYYIPDDPDQLSWGDWIKEPQNMGLLRKHMAEYSTANGVCGVKIMWYQFDYLLCQLRLRAEHQHLEIDDLLSRVFTPPHYIWLTRKDKVGQAVSFWKALQTGEWLAGVYGLAPFWSQKPQYSFLRIHSLVQEIAAHETAWEWYFSQHGIQPLKIVYEELIADRESTILNVLDYLSIDKPEDLIISEPSLKRQSDSLNQEWTEKYYDELQSHEMKLL